jgi:predicted deacylase
MSAGSGAGTPAGSTGMAAGAPAAGAGTRPSSTTGAALRRGRVAEGTGDAPATGQPALPRATLLRGRFAVGTAVAAPGEHAFGHIVVPLPDGGETRIACWVVQGRRARGQALADGPVLYVHAAQHGNEITGIEVVRRVVQALDPRRLRGTLIAVPIANPLAFHWRRHHYLQGPEEPYQARPELDMGQAWPGDPAGTPPQRLAYALWQQAVGRATHVLDLHTWNRWQAAATTVNAWHAPSLDLARAFGLWVQARWQPASPEEGASRYLARVAIDHGKAACTPNFSGQWDIPEPQVRRGVVGLRRVLRHLGMWPQAPRPPRREPPVIFTTDDLVTVTVPDPGLFLPRVQPEAQVRQGQVLGVLVRLEDYRPVEVHAPVDALVYLIGAVGAAGPGADVSLASMMPVARAGSRVARLLPLAPAPERLSAMPVPTAAGR